MSENLWRVVIVYDDTRGGVWRGPPEPREEAVARAAKEEAVVHGTVSIIPAFRRT